MKYKILRYTLYLTVTPLIGMIFILTFRNIPSVRNTVLISVFAFQAVLTLFCRRTMKKFIRPDTDALTELGVKFVPAPYEPGKFAIDSKISSFLMWISLLSPVFTWIAVRFPQKLNVSLLSKAICTVPSMNLMIFALFFMFVGMLAFPFWFESSRTAVIFSEGSDKKRYLMNGFVDMLDEQGSIKKYKAAIKSTSKGNK